MTLHLINKSPDQSSALQDCLVILKAKATKSAILLIEDAVYLAVNHDDNLRMHGEIRKLALPCYILKEDMTMRGLNLELADCFSAINYKDFVQLSLDHNKVQSWS